MSLCSLALRIFSIAESIFSYQTMITGNPVSHRGSMLVGLVQGVLFSWHFRWPTRTRMHPTNEIIISRKPVIERWLRFYSTIPRAHQTRICLSRSGPMDRGFVDYRIQPPIRLCREHHDRFEYPNLIPLPHPYNIDLDNTVNTRSNYMPTQSASAGDIEKSYHFIPHL